MLEAKYTPKQQIRSGKTGQNSGKSQEYLPRPFAFGWHIVVIMFYQDLSQ